MMTELPKLNERQIYARYCLSEARYDSSTYDPLDYAGKIAFWDSIHDAVGLEWTTRQYPSEHSAYQSYFGSKSRFGTRDNPQGTLVKDINFHGVELVAMVAALLNWLTISKRILVWILPMSLGQDLSLGWEIDMMIHGGFLCYQTIGRKSSRVSLTTKDNLIMPQPKLLCHT